MPDNILFPGSPGDAPDVLTNGPVKSNVTTYLDAFKAAYALHDNGLAWEVYVTDPGNTPPEKLVTYIYVPVK